MFLKDYNSAFPVLLDSLSLVDQTMTGSALSTWLLQSLSLTTCGSSFTEITTPYNLPLTTAAAGAADADAEAAGLRTTGGSCLLGTSCACHNVRCARPATRPERCEELDRHMARALR